MNALEHVQFAIHARIDIWDHLLTLKKYSSECDTVVELGVRSVVSTWALLAGNPKRLISVDKVHPNVFGASIGDVTREAKKCGTAFSFIEEDDLKAELPESIDLLFIDTWHVYEQLKAELERLGGRVSKYNRLPAYKSACPPHGPAVAIPNGLY